MYYEFRKARDTAAQKLTRGQTGKRWERDKGRKEDKETVWFPAAVQEMNPRSSPKQISRGGPREWRKSSLFLAQSSDVFAFDLLLYETRTKTATASLAQEE